MVASTTTTCTFGYAALIASSSGGTSQRAVVPITPMRATPVISLFTAATSATRASSSSWMRRARLTTASPSAVSRARGAVDEGHAELALEPGDVGRHVGLHGVQGAGGGREGAVVGDGHEGAQLAEVHRQT